MIRLIPHSYLLFSKTPGNRETAIACSPKVKKNKINQPKASLKFTNDIYFTCYILFIYSIQNLCKKSVLKKGQFAVFQEVISHTIFWVGPVIS